MENEYTFNYEEIKRIFESAPAPATNSTPRNNQVTSHETQFQPHRQSSADTNPFTRLMPAQYRKRSYLMAQCIPVAVVNSMDIRLCRVNQITYTDYFTVESQHDIYLVSKVPQ